MSIPEFSETLKKRVQDNYLQKVKLGSLGEGSIKDLSKSISDSDKFRAAFEAGTAGHDSIITVAGLRDLGQKLAQSAPKGALKTMAQDLFNNLDFNHFINWLETERLPLAARKGGTTKVKRLMGSSGEEYPGLKLENITQSNAKKYFEEYIDLILTTQRYPKQVRTIQRLKKHISENIEAGHLAGIFSLKFKLAFGATINQDELASAKTYRDFSVKIDGENKEFEDMLTVVIRSLLDADYLTSNVVDKEDLFLTAVKYALGENPRLQTELQFGKDNGGSGSLLGSAGKSIKKLITNLTTTLPQNRDQKIYLKEFIQSLTALQKSVEERAKQLQNLGPEYEKLAKSILEDNKTLQSFITSPGSPSIVQGIEQTIASIIKNGKIPKEIKTSVSLKKSTKKKDRVSSNLNKIIKDTVKKVNSVKQTLKKQTEAIRIKYPKIEAKPVPQSPANLVALLNARLRDAIVANMGTGNRTDVLNYRTGRFADSVEVGRVSVSRQGMITAFYTYMKNPYATFSKGGHQEFPRTRDPKSLISKSIRDIAQTLVSNQLRAVNV